MQSTNRVILAAAGSGKTTKLVKEAIEKSDCKIAVLTYTIFNGNEIRKKFYQLNRSIPSNVTVMSWFSFLLQECVRPYQNYVYEKHRIESIAFVNGRSALYVPRSQTEKYFLNGYNIYTDKISEFALICNDKSKDLVLDRLENRYDEIYVDEVQDLAGYDLDLLELLLQTKINILLVGDNRQATYSTNSSARNGKYQGGKINLLFDLWWKKGWCERSYLLENYRCNQAICDFADQLFPEMPSTTSRNKKNTGHDGIFTVAEDKVEEYIATYSPQVLRYNRKTDCMGYPALNFGESKGLSFKNVLIFPNKPIEQFLSTGFTKPVMSTRAKLYVAITRAEASVAFVFSRKCANAQIKPWSSQASQESQQPMVYQLSFN